MNGQTFETQTLFSRVIRDGGPDRIEASCGGIVFHVMCSTAHLHLDSTTAVKAKTDFEAMTTDAVIDLSD